MNKKISNKIRYFFYFFVLFRDFLPFQIQYVKEQRTTNNPFAVLNAAR